MSPHQDRVFVRRYLGDMTGREEHTRQVGTKGAEGVLGRALAKGFAALTFLGGLALIVAGIVNILHLHDRAGGTFLCLFGLAFVLIGRYVWRVANQPFLPVIELTDDSIIFRADIEPFMKVFTRQRTVTYRWLHIGAMTVQPTTDGMTIWVYLDAGAERGERMIPVPSSSPDAAAAFVAEMERLSAKARPDKPTRWLRVGSDQGRASGLTGFSAQPKFPPRATDTDRMSRPRNEGRAGVRGKLLRLGILSVLCLAAGIAALLWCSHTEATYCRGAGGLIALGVFGIVGMIGLYRRR
jgi:hypothetical protein